MRLWYPLLALSCSLAACKPLAAPLIIAGDVIEGTARLSRAAVVGTQRMIEKDRDEDPPSHRSSPPTRSSGRPSAPPTRGGDPFLEPLPPIIEE
jgi:hypothetical protein